MMFAESLRLKRKERRLTQIQLCKILGVSQSMISQYECGKRTPSIYTAVRIAKALGTTCEDMVCPKPIEEPEGE